MKTYKCFLLVFLFRWTTYGANALKINPWKTTSKWMNLSPKKLTPNPAPSCRRSGGPQIDCGYPGITLDRCASVGCCWDNSIPGRAWCFHPVTSGTVKQRHFSSRGSRISQQRGTNTDKARNPVDPFASNGNPKKQTHMSQPNNKVYNPQRKSNFPFASKVAATRPPSATQKINNFLLLLFPHLKRSLNRKQFAKKSTIGRIRVNRSRHPSPIPPSPRPSQNRLGNIRDFVAYVNFLKGLDRVKSSPQTEVCELDGSDFCCRHSPTAPCCRYNETPKRPAPMPRVVGGTPAQFLGRSVAYLSKNQRHFCGGALISDQWVLTAAHCVADYCRSVRTSKELSVSLGKISKSPFRLDVGQQTFRVARVVCHHDQCKSGNRPRLNDVALLRLSRSVVMTPFVRAVHLPFPHENPSSDSRCIGLGWGNTRGSGHSGGLKQVEVPIYTNHQCNHRDWRGCLVKSCMLCAGSLNADLCDGDSGGPLFCPRSNGLYVLQGVYSWGRCGADEKKPSIYTRTSHFVGWIDSITRG